jgi:branched-chain amino acid transport system substrate-binding protein
MLKKLVLLVAVFALSFTFSVKDATSAEKEFRIGWLAAKTGWAAQIGKDMTNGFKMYLEQQNYKFGPLKVKFIYEDNLAKPPVNVRKAMKLIKRDKVHLFSGGLLASTGYALAPLAERTKVLYISPIPAADDLTQRKRYKNFVRLGFTSSQNSHPQGQWACEQGFKKVVTIAADYAFGYETVGGFQKTFEACGGKIIKKLWPKIGTKDFAPYLAKFPKDLDAVFTLMVGGMSLSFPKQFRGAGFKAPMLGGITSADEFILPNMGDEAIGYVTAGQYSAALDTKKNLAFVKEYQKRYGKMASYYSESCYTAALFIHKALEKINYKYDRDKFKAAIRSLRVDAIRGPVYLDKYDNPVHNVYIRKVVRIPGDYKGLGVKPNSLWNKVIKTYPAIGQFYPDSAEKFLKQPVYSKNYPACKHCR